MEGLTRREWLRSATGAAAAGMAALSARGALAGEAAAMRPNIVLIVADDLGYGDLGSYGQLQIQTPNLDRMAHEGMRFTQAYAGSTVCAPSRCCLMTGYDTGHARIRGNGLQFLQADDVTVAQELQAAGYTTACIGKWGLGDAWTQGTPPKHGFDLSFGYLDQIHAHNYYPSILYLNGRPVPIPGNLGPLDQRKTYSDDLFTAAALQFIKRQDGTNPFFLYLPYTIPHADTVGSWLGAEGLPVPSEAPYTNEPWPHAEKNYAAMVTRMDRDIGQIMQTLQDRGLAENTLVLFTSDNGPHKEGGNNPAFFYSSGGLRGIKRDLYEGGIRVPLIAWWPGTIAPKQVSNLQCAFWDFFPTFTELAGAQTPAGLDGLSIVPELIGEQAAGRPQEHHEYLYWEFDELGFRQAVRMGDWKAVTEPRTNVLELYDLATDEGETTNVADQHPDVVATMRSIMTTARTPFTRPIHFGPFKSFQPTQLRRGPR